MGGVVHTYDINEDDLIDGKEFLHDIRKKGSQIVMVFYVTSLWMVLKVILELLIMIFIRVIFWLQKIVSKSFAKSMILKFIGQKVRG